MSVKTKTKATSNSNGKSRFYTLRFSSIRLHIFGHEIIVRSCTKHNCNGLCVKWKCIFSRQQWKGLCTAEVVVMVGFVIHLLVLPRLASLLNSQGLTASWTWMFAHMSAFVRRSVCVHVLCNHMLHFSYYINVAGVPDLSRAMSF